MEKIEKTLTTSLTVGKEPIVAASKEVLGNQRRIGARHTLEIYNNSDNIVFFGGMDVTPETGMPMLPDERRTFRVGSPYAIWLAANQDSDVRIAEFCSV